MLPTYLKKENNHCERTVQTSTLKFTALTFAKSWPHLVRATTLELYSGQSCAVIITLPHCQMQRFHAVLSFSIIVLNIVILLVSGENKCHRLGFEGYSFRVL